MMMISMDKEYRTRDGREVRIYATDGISPSPIHGAFLTIDGWATCNWTKTGEKFLAGESFIDLIEVKPRIQRTVWVNVFPNAMTMYPEKEKADYYAGYARLACVKVEIDCEEGHGL
jgi:hypothetical protein